MENIMDKIKLIESAVVVAEFWGVTPSELVGFVGSFVKPEKKDKWNEMVEEVQEFYKLPIGDRAERAGFTVSKLTTK